MPNPNQPSPGYDTGYIGLKDAPGADVSFDDLFPPEGSESATAPQAAAGTTPPQTPQAQEPPKPFLKAGETVYLTEEDAANGTVHKDELIARYRAFLKQGGYDPNTFQRIAGQEPQATQTEPQSPYTYLGKGKKLYEDMARAVDSRDPAAYERVLAQYTAEAINSELSPYGPLLAEVSRQRAIRQLEQENPEFQAFANSEDFRKPQLQILDEAIKQSESDPRAAEHLRQLYQLKYLTYRGMKAGSAQPPAPPVTPPAARPQTTMPPATITPPAPGMTPAQTNDWATNHETRKQMIKDMEQRGYRDLDWRNVGR